MFTKKYAIVEPLYLDKDYNGKEIYISGQQAVKLRQLERDGLRFLYRHFKKKSLGAIMNDPPSHGKLVQEVLLLQSLQNVLDPTYPSLVITNAADIQDWKHIFSAFYENYENDVIFEPRSIYEKKKIFVCQAKLMRSYSQRKWSIIIIDDCDCTTNPKSYMSDLKLMKSDFKIWNSSLNIVDNLDLLKMVHNYIYNHMLDIKYLTDIGYGHKMNIIGEFCLRRDSIGDGEHMMLDIDNEVPLVETSKVSKKNKDPTGTKVKSSKKRKLDNENDPETAIRDLSQPMPSASCNPVAHTNVNNKSNNIIHVQQNTENDPINTTKDDKCYFIIKSKNGHSNDKKLTSYTVFMPCVGKIKNSYINDQVWVKENEFKIINKNNNLIAPLKLEVDSYDNSLDKVEITKDVSLINYNENINIDNGDDLMVPLRLETDSDNTNSDNEMCQNKANKNEINEDFKSDSSHENEQNNIAIGNKDVVTPIQLGIHSNKSGINVNNEVKNNDNNKNEINKVINKNVIVKNKINTTFDDSDVDIVGDKSMYEKILNQFF